MTPFDLAYMAGFFDGEGSAGISRMRNPKGLSFGIEVSVTNTNKEIILFFKRHFGGRLATKGGTGKHKLAWQLHFTKDESKVILTSLLPFLRVKRRQAELVLEFIETCQHRNPHNRPTVNEQALREVIYEEVAELNKRGV